MQVSQFFQMGPVPYLFETLMKNAVHDQFALDRVETCIYAGTCYVRTTEIPI